MKKLSLPIPRDSGKKVAFSRRLLYVLGKEQDILLHVTTTGIWPSSENRDVFELVRRGLGITATLKEEPGSLFSRGERMALESCLVVVVWNFWDALLVGGEQELAVMLSHDEVVDFYFGLNMVDCMQKAWGGFYPNLAKLLS